VARQSKRLADLKATWRKSLSEKTKSKRALGGERENGRAREGYLTSATKSRRLRAEIQDASLRLERLRCSIGGERELFDQYVLHSGKVATGASWSVLAEMRHHGVPTRFLDWTDRLYVALYFALMDADADADAKNGPCLWLLNPYELSYKVSGRTSIWSVHHYPELDYHSCFHRERSWPFDHPLPIVPPLPFDRIKAQGGSFTVFGNDKQPLETQLTSRRFLRCIKINPEVATFALDYLHRVQGISRFQLFRDLDSLGAELHLSYARIQEYLRTRRPGRD
jgi:hypothetical protein